MRMLKIFSASLFLSLTTLNASNTLPGDGSAVVYSETPEKTIFIKHPAANNITAFFSTSTVLLFEVYKPGSKEDIANILQTLSKDANVKSCTEGVRTGDYQAFTLDLKSMANKEWFVKLFKSAGLNTIKVNTNPIVQVDKL